MAGWTDWKSSWNGGGPSTSMTLDGRSMNASTGEWGSSPSPGMGGLSIAGGATAAAAQTIGGIANAAAQQQARDAALQLSQLQMSGSEKLAKLRLAASRDAFNKNSKADAYQALIAALGQQNSTAMDGRQVRRGATQSMEQAFAQAMLRGQ